MATVIVPARSELLEEHGELQLWRLGTERLAEFTEYVYRIYRDTRAKRYNWVPTTEREEMVRDGELYFPRARTCAVTGRDGRLVGTWGMILKDCHADEFQLPIEKRFEITPDEIRSKMQSGARYLVNGWRTAIDKDALEDLGIEPNRSIFIFDLLLRGLTEDMREENTNYLGVAEMENLVLRYHRRVGVPWEVIGDKRAYWGNEKFPCCFRFEDYKQNMQEHHPERFAFIYGRVATESP